MASCKVAIVPYIIGVVVGMTPRTALFVGSAAAAASTGAGDIQTFITEGKGGLVLLLGLMVFVTFNDLNQLVFDRIAGLFQ